MVATARIATMYRSLHVSCSSNSLLASALSYIKMFPAPTRVCPQIVSWWVQLFWQHSLPVCQTDRQTYTPRRSFCSNRPCLWRWWQLCKAFNCRILYGLYLPTVILTIIWYSITHSLFHSSLKTFSANPFLLQPFLFLLQDSLHAFPRLFTVVSEHRPICFLLLVFLFVHFLVVGSVR